MTERYIWGIGKGNKPFKVHFSKKTSNDMREWLKLATSFNTPFKMYSSTGRALKNPYDKLIRILKKECDITPHQIRHALGHYLRVYKGWDIVQIKEKLRHESIATTQIYAEATAEEIEEKEDIEIFEDEDDSS